MIVFGLTRSSRATLRTLCFCTRILWRTTWTWATPSIPLPQRLRGGCLGGTEWVCQGGAPLSERRVRPSLSERRNHLVFAVGVGDTERRMVLGLKGLVVVGDVMVKVIQA